MWLSNLMLIGDRCEPDPLPPYGACWTTLEECLAHDMNDYPEEVGVGWQLRDKAHEYKYSTTQAIGD